MTTEEKAKRYDKAFGIARNVWRFSSNNAEIMRMEELFPELRESEGERIRKELIYFDMEASDRIYFDGNDRACKLPIFSSTNIEYIRTDAFIEKAVKWLEDNAINYWGTDAVDNGKMMLDFKIAMKL